MAKELIGDKSEDLRKGKNHLIEEMFELLASPSSETDFVDEIRESKNVVDIAV